ncbi:hypothetical protein VN97_g863 [Penicillium thymicola]|uniref:Uncharacterized protein n=1 Tax=Penicillium thymicola TaxID=293382 RepID=A0AAI9TTC9_PENTH|nr:hypothetical protein VN97_g863 [Penicillium thymicola]
MAREAIVSHHVSWRRSMNWITWLTWSWPQLNTLLSLCSLSCLPSLFLHVWIDHVYCLSHPICHILRRRVDLFTNAQTSSLYWWTALTQW